MGKNWPKIVFFQVFEKKFGIKFRCEKIYWNNFKILNKKYFWNAKVEIKITILFKCLQKIFWSNSAVKNKIVSNLSLEFFFYQFQSFEDLFSIGYIAWKMEKSLMSALTIKYRWKVQVKQIIITVVFFPHTSKAPPMSDTNFCNFKPP